MWFILYRAPALFPMASCLYNVVSFVMGLLNERRIKVGAFKFSILYASTIPAALRRDLTPYFTVVSLPPTN